MKNEKTEVPIEVPIQAPQEVPVEAPKQTPVEVPIHVPIEIPKTKRNYYRERPSEINNRFAVDWCIC